MKKIKIPRHWKKKRKKWKKCYNLGSQQELLNSMYNLQMDAIHKAMAPNYLFKQFIKIKPKPKTRWQKFIEKVKYVLGYRITNINDSEEGSNG